MQKLVLYLDNAYIIPVIIQDDGRVIRYDNSGKKSFWLYFKCDTQNQKVDYGEIYQHNYYEGQVAYYGDYFTKCLDSSATVDLGFGTLSAKQLLEYSNILKEIKVFAKEYGLENNIPTVLLFSENIQKEAIKSFVSYLNDNDFTILSYSKLLVDILIQYIQKFTRQPQFNEKVLVIQSSGRNLLLSMRVFDGTQFIQCKPIFEIPNVGESILKKSLVEYVVNLAEKDHNFLYNTQQREKEYIAQMQFVNDWLEKIKNENSDKIQIRFKYSFEEKEYIYSVSKEILRNIQENAAQDVFNKLRNYYSKEIHNDLYKVILYGRFFDDEVAQNAVKRIVGEDNKVVYFNESSIQDVLIVYNELYTGLQEDINDCNSIFADRESSLQQATIWVENAKQVGDFYTESQEILKKCKEVSSNYQKSLSACERKWEELMKKSDFLAASDELQSFENEKNTIQGFEETYKLFEKKKDTLQQVFVLLSQFTAAKQIITDIERKFDEIKTEREKITDVTKKYKEDIDKTTFYRDKYDEYKNKLREFEKSIMITEKRNILNELQGLTMEELPVILNDSVNITKKAEIKVEGGFFKKKKMLDVSWESDSPLPCDSCLVVSPVSLIKLDRSKGIIIYDFSKGGKSGEKKDIDISTFADVYVYVWPNEKSVISINQFKQNPIKL